MKSRVFHRSFVQLGSLAAALGTAALLGSACTPDPTIHLSVDSVTDLGPLSMPATVPGRDGGWSGLVFGKLLWTFGDSFITVKGEDGLNVRSSTAAWSGTDTGFTSLTEPLTASGIPKQFIPYTAEENAANQADAANGWALWGGTVLTVQGTDALVLYSKVKRSSGGGFQTVSNGIARVADGATVARRDPTPLFALPEPIYSEGFSDGQFVYLYNCDITSPLNMTCRVARAAIADADKRASYRFFDGASWVADITKAKTVVEGAASGFSVAWNEWLGTYLAVHSELLGTGLRLRTAPSPEGPWSAPVSIAADGVHILPNTDGAFGNYLAVQHHGLESPDGRELVVTYSRPLSPFHGEVRAARIRLGE